MKRGKKKKGNIPPVLISYAGYSWQANCLKMRCKLPLQRFYLAQQCIVVQIKLPPNTSTNRAKKAVLQTALLVCYFHVYCRCETLHKYLTFNKSKIKLAQAD